MTSNMNHRIVVNIPETMYSKAEKIAQSRHLTVEQMLEEQFFHAVERYWQDFSKNISRQDFETVLSRVPDVEPEDYDKL